MNSNNDNKSIANWLIICAIVIFSMILLGGVTRLTQSGLSMVEWKPVTGIIPPLSETDWQAEFDKYKNFPEFQKMNTDMELSGFKSIYLFEYAHRVLGRLIGFIFLIPFLFFYFKRKISTSLKPKLITLFILGGLQGLLGWYMVKSGLVDNPRVSQYRLTAHLGMAVIIYVYMLWLAFNLSIQKPAYRLSTTTPYYFSIAFTACIFIMILSGGFVAGTHAGHAFNTFPLMGDRFIPDNLWIMSPAWINIFENTTTIQFNHRILAYIITAFALTFITFILREKVNSKINMAALLLLAALILQLTLGISTLLLRVPVALGAAHQGGAILLLTASLYLTCRLRAATL